jgi:hypothetical protein
MPGGSYRESLSFHVTTTRMDLSASGPPSERNSGLPFFRELAEVVKEALVPNQKDHKEWARRTLEVQLSQASECRDALWASVLGLWRLQYLQPSLKDAGEELRGLWRLHTSALLVSGDRRSRLNNESYATVLQGRHLSICVDLNIEPFPVVREFAKDMLAFGHLEHQDVPSWETEEPAPALAPGSDREAPEPVVEDHVDVKMSEVAPAQKKRKQIRPAPVKMARAHSTGSDAGNKRDFSARAPEKPQGPVKRSRLGDTPQTEMGDTTGPSTRSTTKKSASTVGTSANTSTTVVGSTTTPFQSTSGSTALPTTFTSASRIPPLPARPGETCGHPNTVQATPLQIFYTDIIALDRKASDPSNSVIASKIYRSEIRSIMLREKNDAQAILEKMNDRRVIWSGLLAKLNASIVSVGGQALQEPSDEEGSTGP